METLNILEKYYKITETKSEAAKASKECTGGCFINYECKLCGWKYSYATCGMFSGNLLIKGNPLKEHLEYHVIDKQLSNEKK